MRRNMQPQSETQDNNMTLFDRIMHLPGIRLFEPFYKKYKVVLLYLFFGGIAFVLNIVLYILFAETLKINVLIANGLCWIICVLFQFFTNRVWVFDSKTDSANDFTKQLFMFVAGRLFTLVVEEIIIAIFITWLGFNSIAVKMIAQVIVIVLNYIISKAVVFRRQ